MKRAVIALFALMVLAVIGSVRFHGSTAQAATPLPSGCYTDSSGLPVCGPNYLPSGAVPLPSPPIQVTTSGGASTISRLPAAGYDACWDLGMICDNSHDNATAINANTFNPLVTNVNCAGLYYNSSYLNLPAGIINTTNNCRFSSLQGGLSTQRALTTITVNSPPACQAQFGSGSASNGFACDQGAAALSAQSTVNAGAVPSPSSVPTANVAYVSYPQLAQINQNYTTNTGGQYMNTDGTKGNRTKDSANVQNYYVGPTALGDHVMNSCTGTANGGVPPLTGANPGAWNGETAIACSEGALKAQAPDQFLHLWGQDTIQDNGFNITAIMFSYHANRTVAAAPTCSPDPWACLNIWEGIDITSGGNCGMGACVPIDSMMRLSGSANIGYDFTKVNYKLASPTPIPDIAMKANDWIDFNCTNSHNGDDDNGTGPYSRYTVCPQTGIWYSSTDAALELGVAASPAVKIVAAGLEIPTVPVGNAVCLTTNNLVSPCPSPAAAATQGPILFGTLGQAVSTPSPASTWVPIPCATNAVNCSGNTITVTSLVNNAGNGEWLATVNFDMGISTEITTQFLTGCVTATVAGSAVPAGNLLDFTSGNMGGGTGNLCTSTLANKILGIPNFGNSAVASPGLHSSGSASFIVPNSSAVAVVCYFQDSSTAAPSVGSKCNVRLDRY